MRNKEIGVYNLNNELIKTYSGIIELSRTHKIATQTIKKYISKNIPYKNLYYRYTNDSITPKTANSKNVCLDITQKKDDKFWEIRVCPICGKQFYARKKYDKITCSQDCYNQYVLIHRKEISEKISHSNKKIHADRTTEEKKQIYDKVKQTCLDRYGVTSYQKTNEYRQMLSSIFKDKDWSERTRKNQEKLYSKYLQICAADNLTLLDFKGRFNCTVKCNVCGSVFDTHVLGYLTEKTNHNLCRCCHPIIFTTDSRASNFIEQILQENNIDFIKNDRTIIPPYEIDILIPSLKMCFEINGNFWHSELNGNKNSTYHINKTKEAFKKGYKLIHIFEDEILLKPNIVKSRILNLINKTPVKIGARKCYIKKIDSSTKKEFFINNHIDGDAPSKINIGLFYGNELVAAASFGKRKISSKVHYELIRFANKLNHNVVGGFSKILRYFQNNFQTETLITYADIRWSGIDINNNVYVKNGFIFEKYTTPNYFYIDKPKYLIRLNRMNFTKQKLRKKNIFEEGLTESEIMFKNNFDRIWDCGSMKFYLNKKGEI